jgi:cobalt-precorrin 5A hydrolase
MSELEELLVDAFAQHQLSLESLACIATAELKRGEEGLEQLAAKFGAPLRHFSADELNSVFDAPAAEHSPTPSARAHSLVGVWGVAEPAALLESGADGLLVERRNTDRATIAVARRPFAWPSAGGQA